MIGAASLFAFAGILAAPGAERRPVPDAKAQKTAEASVRELYRDGYAAKDPAARLDLAKKLLASAAPEKTDGAVLYVLLREAGDIALQCGDVELTLEAADRLGREFAVDATALKLEKMKSLARPGQSPEAQTSYVKAYAGMIRSVALDRGNKDASQLTLRAAGVAEKSGCPFLKEKVSFWRDLLQQNRDEVDAVSVQHARLARTQDDFPANLAVGRFLCLLLEDWEQGLNMLARSQDPELTPLAKRDMAGPSDAAEQLSLGDAWLRRSQEEKGTQARNMVLRGYYWYLKALQGLDGIERAKLELKLAEMPRRYLADMDRFDAVGWDRPRERGPPGPEGPNLVRSFSLQKGIVLHPTEESSARVKYRLGGRFENFQAFVGLPDRATRFRGSLTFSVHGDGKPIWSSTPVTQPGRIQQCKVKVAGVEVLELRVVSRGGRGPFGEGGQAVWVDPFVSR